MDAQRLRDNLEQAAPSLWAAIEALVQGWTVPILQRLDGTPLRRPYPKTFNDPVWGTIELRPHEILLLDSPLLQRLRSVRQLGMAHHVYPSACHNRLEHSLGVVEAADRMIVALDRNAAHRREYPGRDADREAPQATEMDRVTTRLAALLHDVGHGSFSHVSERLIERRLRPEISLAQTGLRQAFPDVTNIKSSEVIAVLVVLSRAMQRVFEHARFDSRGRPAELAPAIAARILGSRECLGASYLSGVISGPLDADKLDWMGRDSYHAGLTVGLDLDRLISKLEVVTVTPRTAPNDVLRECAENAPSQTYFEMGVSLAGIGAYEQMIIARVLLYERLYMHQKIRCAEAMVKKLIGLAEEERGQPFALSDLMAFVSDDTMVELLGGIVTKPGFQCGGAGARAIAQAIRTRDLYHRAFVVAGRFITGLQGRPDGQREETKQLQWNGALDGLLAEGGKEAIAGSIIETARSLGRVLDGVIPDLEGLGPEHVVVDLPQPDVVVPKADILTRSRDGHVGMPTLFFNPERWTQAYEWQKRCGYVFAPQRYVPLVALAARLVFFERFRLVMVAEADHVAKTVGAVPPGWLEKAREAGVCSDECAEVLAAGTPLLARVEARHFRLPDAWLGEAPQVPEEMAGGFRNA